MTIFRIVQHVGSIWFEGARSEQAGSAVMEKPTSGDLGKYARTGDDCLFPKQKNEHT
ncbi:MAG: hypothetical protein WA996_18575 [Candidatus Promineifilaceae bacterium]